MTDDNKSAQANEGETKETPKVGRRLGEETLTQKIDNQGRPVVFLPGTLTFVDDACIERHPELADKKGKQVVQKVCMGEYEEGEEAPTFFVATSDLHQTFYAAHNGMRQKMKNKKAAERRAAKKAKAEQDAAELAEHRSAVGE